MSFAQLYDLDRSIVIADKPLCERYDVREGLIRVCRRKDEVFSGRASLDCCVVDDVFDFATSRTNNGDQLHAIGYELRGKLGYAHRQTVRAVQNQFLGKQP